MPLTSLPTTTYNTIKNKPCREIHLPTSSTPTTLFLPVQAFTTASATTYSQAYVVFAPRCTPPARSDLAPPSPPGPPLRSSPAAPTYSPPSRPYPTPHPYLSLARLYQQPPYSSRRSPFANALVSTPLHAQ